jgi:hypothetical protein
MLKDGEEKGPLEFVVGAAFIGLIIYLVIRKKREPTAAAMQPPVQQPPHVIEKIIERQVVVERCPHCDQLSPVTAGACEHCGAPR